MFLALSPAFGWTTPVVYHPPDFVQASCRSLTVLILGGAAASYSFRPASGRRVTRTSSM
jgi:hypothetical protein